MLGSFLMGLVGGQRAMTPLASVAVAAARGELRADNGAPPIIAHPVFAAGALVLAVGEMVGDQMKSAPDRIAPIGLAARFMTSAVAGAALAPRGRRWLGAGIAGATAVIAAYPGWRIRIASMARFGPAGAGFVEDAAILASAFAIVRAWRKPL